MPSHNIETLNRLLDGHGAPVEWFLSNENNFEPMIYDFLTDNSDFTDWGVFDIGDKYEITFPRSTYMSLEDLLDRTDPMHDIGVFAHVWVPNYKNFYQGLAPVDEIEHLQYEVGQSGLPLILTGIQHEPIGEVPYW